MLYNEKCLFILFFACIKKLYLYSIQNTNSIEQQTSVQVRGLIDSKLRPCAPPISRTYSSIDI